eukprot:2859919-Rhodomonas_salina.1
MPLASAAAITRKVMKTAPGAFATARPAKTRANHQPQNRNPAESSTREIKAPAASGQSRIGTSDYSSGPRNFQVCWAQYDEAACRLYV